jgi:two-component system, cell cycle sensor histidine kinase and response regulator CckA
MPYYPLMALDASLRETQLLAEISALQQELARYKASQVVAPLPHPEEACDYHTIINNSVEAILVIKGGTIAFCNPRAYKVLGYAPDEFLNQPFTNFIYPDDLMMVVNRYHNRIAGLPEPDTYAFRVFAKGGAVRWVETRVVLVTWQDDLAALNFLHDITERVQAEELVREREAIYSALLDRANDGITIVQDSQLVYLNSRLAEILGYTVAEMLDSPFSSYLHPESVSLVTERYVQRLRGEDVPPRYEATLVHRDGRPLKVMLNAGLITYHGRVADFVFVTDITESKRATRQAQALLDRQIVLNRLAMLLSNTTQEDEICELVAECVRELLPVDGLILSFFDEVAQEIRAAYCLSFGQVIPVATLPPLPLAPEGKGLQSQVIRTGEPLYVPNYQIASKEHQVYHTVSSRGEVMTNPTFENVPEMTHSYLYVPMKVSGKTIGILQIQALPVDVYTPEDLEWLSALANLAAIAFQNARLLAQMRQQAQQMQQIINIVPEGVVLLNGGNKVVLANPAAEAYLVALAGVGLGDEVMALGQRPLADLLQPLPDDLWHEVTANSRTFGVIARPLATGPHDNRWVLVIHDSTREREINQRVQLQERLASLGQLAAGIAHDFNNIMTVIALYADLIQRGEKLLSPQARHRIGLIIQQSNRASDLIEQILDFSRASLLERRPLHLLALLKELVKLLDRTLIENVAMEVVYEPGRFIINADLTRIQQMVMNLALNARDAMPEGGQLRFGLKEIWVSGPHDAPLPELTPGAWVQFTISDTGRGIEPNVLPRIFDPFFTTKEPGQGSGLGLAQVWGIVRQHEGYLDVTTQAGTGTTFTIYLPSQDDEESRLTPISDSVFPMGHQETILVVEDNYVTREALVDSLKMLDYQVITAENGREALNILATRREEIALIVSDVVMPQLGGIGLVQELARLGTPMKVLLLSGHPLDAEADQFRQYDAIAWLPKPVTMEQLASTVRALIGLPTV